MYLYGVVLISIILGFLPIGRSDRVINQEPAVVVAPSVNTIHVHKKSRLVLDCPVTSKARELHFFWYKDEVEVSQGKRVHVDKNGSLVIEKVLDRHRRGRNDAGLYECFVENNYGEVLGRRVEVIIVAKQSLSLVPELGRMVLGGVARFQCHLDDPSQPAPHYIWQTPLANGIQVAKFDASHLGVLHVYNVSRENEGSYTCKVVSHDGMLEKSAFLQIEDSSGLVSPTVPQLLNTSQHITVTAGQTALLECLLQGALGATITWRYPGGSPSMASPDRVVQFGHSNIKISNSQREDSGTYMCVVKLSGGQELQRAYTLDVLVAPTFRNEPLPIKANVLVQRARLYCNASGNPTPTIHWYKDGLKIFPSPQSELVIHGRSDEIGYYQCLAENSVGYVISTTWMTFTMKSHTPIEVKNVSGEAVSPTVIQLKWDPILKQTPTLISYGIDYHRVSDLQCPGRCMHLFQRAREVSKITTLNITNLTPYTLYAFSVQGYNYNGAGAMSEELMVRTLEAVPSTSPDVQITPDTETSFRVLWTELPRSEANGIIIKHKLSYGTELKMEVTELNGDARDYLVIGRDPDTLYKVRVLAGNSAGYPDINDNWVTYRTPARRIHIGTVDTPVLTFESINSSTVLVRWSHGGEGVGSYRIMIQKQLEGGRVHEYNISTDNDKFVIGGLENRTFYKVDFMVKDNFNNVISQVTELYQSLNPDDAQAPPPPMILDPHPVSSSTIQVSWQRPKTSLDIVKYTVKYQQRQGEEFVAEPKFVESNNQVASVVGLQSYTWYVISVRSHTLEDQGPFSKPVIVQTLEGVPSPPENLLAEVVSPGTVKLKWAPPRKQNGIITYYIIYYNPDKNVPDRAWNSIQQNASTTSVVVNDLSGRIYYFKLRACTKAGEGNSTNVIMINTLECGEGCPLCTKACVTNSPSRASVTSVFEQRLGIIIGCMVGLVCCIICVTVIVIKHRSYGRLRAAAVYGRTSSDHHVGRYLSQQTNDESLSAASRAPFLNGQLPENTGSDSKGGQYAAYRSEPDKNLILLAGSQGGQMANGRQLPGERRALLSPSSSSSHGNDTSSNPTLDTGTMESSFSTPDRVQDYDITSCNRMVTSCESSEPEENNDGCPSTEEPPENCADKHREHPIERSHSGSHDSGFEIDFNVKTCENNKLCSSTDFNEKHPHVNINC